MTNNCPRCGLPYSEHTGDVHAQGYVCPQHREAKENVEKVDGAKGIDKVKARLLFACCNHPTDDRRIIVDEFDALTAQLTKARDALLVQDKIITQQNAERRAINEENQRNYLELRDERDAVQAQLDEALEAMARNYIQYIGDHRNLTWWYPGRPELNMTSDELSKRSGDFQWRFDIGGLPVLWPFFEGKPLLYGTSNEISKLAALQSPSPCANACAMRFWVEREVISKPGAPVTHVIAAHCLLCDERRKAAQSMYELFMVRDDKKSFATPEDWWNEVLQAFNKLPGRKAVTKDIRTEKETKMTQDKPAYRVELDTEGCSLCKNGKTYNVVGPDDVATGTTYDDQDEAEEIASALTAAYDAGAKTSTYIVKKLKHGKSGFIDSNSYNRMETELERLKKVNLRLHDLVRYKRGALFTEQLITQDEYTELAKDHPAVARLEGYDKMRNDRDDALLNGAKLMLAAAIREFTDPYATTNSRSSVIERLNNLDVKAITAQQC